jgi:hypothetical protein
MKTKSNLKRYALTLAFALVCLIGVKGMPYAGPAISKLHSAVQRIINVSQYSAGVNAFNDSTTYLSSTVDLSGGDLEKMSFGISFSSGAVSYVTGSSATLNIQISPDGGTTWLTRNPGIYISTNGTTAVTTYYYSIGVAPGTKMRVSPDLADGATIYNLKVWAIPSVD